MHSWIAGILRSLNVNENLGAHSCKILVPCLVVTIRPWHTDVLRTTVASRVLKHRGTRSNMREIEVFCNCDNECKLVMLVGFTLCWKKITGNNTISLVTHRVLLESYYRQGMVNNWLFRLGAYKINEEGDSLDAHKTSPVTLVTSSSGTEHHAERQVPSLSCLRTFNPLVLPSIKIP